MAAKSVTNCYNCFKSAAIIQLNCQHVFCAKCLIKPLSNLENTTCPFQNGTYRCTYKLEVGEKQFITNAIKISLSEPDIKPKPNQKIVRQPAINKIQDASYFYNSNEKSGEVIFHCREANCVGFWFIEVTEIGNPFQCPVCESFNIYSLNAESEHPMISNKTTWTCVFCEYSDNIMDVDICVLCLQANDRNMKTRMSSVSEHSYSDLVQLEKSDNFIPNFYEFECSICTEMIEPDNGVLLRTCFHNFCLSCLRKYIEDRNELEIKCPNYECAHILEDREIKTLISPDAYRRHLEISLRVGKTSLKNGYQCCVPNCPGWWIFTEGIYDYDCLVCQTVNCIACKASHPDTDCDTYQNDLFYSTDKNGIETKQKLKVMLESGEAEHCPKCNIIVVRNGGCPKMHCGMCRTDFVWGQQANRDLNLK